MRVCVRCAYGLEFAWTSVTLALISPLFFQMDEKSHHHRPPTPYGHRALNIYIYGKQQQLDTLLLLFMLIRI